MRVFRKKEDSMKYIGIGALSQLYANHIPYYYALPILPYPLTYNSKMLFQLNYSSSLANDVT